MRYLFSFLASLLVSLGWAQTAEEVFQPGIDAYRSVLEQDKQSAPLFFNLGNAYFKSGQTAKAILSYERALRLNPGDPEVQQNLELARESVIDRFEEMPRPLFQTFFRNFVKLFSPDAWAVLTVAFGLFIITGGFLYLFTSFKRPGFILAVSALLLCGLSWFLAARHHALLQNNRAAIVMTQSSYVKSGPGEKAEDVFILHAGAKAVVKESYEGWSKIQLPDGKIGWIRSGDIEII